MAIIYIDDKEFEVEDGENILQAVLGLGLDLPYFCWHPEMGSVGACRQCALVQYSNEEDTQGRIVMGCMTPVSDGARFSMQGPDASEFRNNIVESLMLNHPHDCPVCAEGGECHLQDMTVMVGHRNRSYRGKKNTHRNQNLGPLINHEMNRCISCYRCTRFYNDYAGGTDLAALAAHDHVYFGRHEDGILESEFAGNLVEVCPTGVFTDKPLVNDYTRKWDLQSAPSICSGCAVGCNILPGERYGKLKRIHNRYNNEINGYFLCDRGRYGGDFVNDNNRALFAGLKNSAGKYDAIQNTDALNTLSEWCAKDKRVVAIGSPRASLETNYLLEQLVGKENFCSGIADHELQLLVQIKQNLQQGSVVSPSLKQIESADAVLILGEDVTNTAPRLALSLRQSVQNLAKQMATDMKIPLWQDEAVRNLAQDQLSPLFIVSMSGTRLADIAEKTISLAPDDIARLGYAVAATIDSNLPTVDLSDSTQLQMVKDIADALTNAKRPLVISGASTQNQAVIDAAAAIAMALDNSETMLKYCLPEFNSMGLCLTTQDQHLSFSTIFENAANSKIDTLLIVENDLYRRAEAAQIDMLIKNVSNVAVFDCVNTSTISKSQLALPAASVFESEGTVVSCEGRAQRFYPVFQPAEQRQASWQWILNLGKIRAIESFTGLVRFDQVSDACAASNVELASIGDASPNAEFRDRGMKIPRQTHRYSGRTAIRANISVHEPKQPSDQDTPFSFSMEGANSGKSAALIPFVWSPGWNSNQSLHKFQDQAGGTLSGGTPGVRLIRASGTSNTNDQRAPEQFKAISSKFLLLPSQHIFGSEELSARSPAIKELTPVPYLQVNAKDADTLGAKHGDQFTVLMNDIEIQVDLQINESTPLGCAAYSAGLIKSEFIAPNTMIKLSKVKNQKSQSTGNNND